MSDDVKFLLRQRTTVVWFLLVAATCMSWSMGSGLWTADPANAELLSTLLISVAFISVAFISVAFIKVRFVIRYFMEVREAGTILRRVTDLWCVAVCLTILALYWQVV